jgi:hypothetical protein
METLDENSRRLYVGTFYKNNRHRGKAYTVNHFRDQKIGRSTIYKIINRVDEEKSLERLPGSGRPLKLSKSKIDKFIEENVCTVSKSFTKLGKKLGVHRDTAKSYLIKYGVLKEKRKIVPKSNESQKVKQKKCLNKLRRGSLKPSLSVQIIEDDESYFTLDGSNNYGNEYYFSHPSLETPENVKFIYKEKFQSKVLVWIAISPRGLSQPYIVQTKGFAINSNIYVNECIKGKLVPFIKKCYSDNNYIFWPDLASCHYARDTIAAFNELKIRYVPKGENPPNVPQLRKIERFWSHLKRNVYNNGWTAKTIEDLIKKIKSEIKKFTPEYCQNLLKSTKTSIRKAADNGPLSVIK